MTDLIAQATRLKSVKGGCPDCDSTTTVEKGRGDRRVFRLLHHPSCQTWPGGGSQDDNDPGIPAQRELTARIIGLVTGKGNGES